MKKKKTIKSTKPTDKKLSKKASGKTFLVSKISNTKSGSTKAQRKVTNNWNPNRIASRSESN